MCDPTELNEANIKTATLGMVLKDATIAGLQLRVKATKKVFCLYYRTKAGVERRPTIGAYGSITLAQARKIARDMLGEVAAGKDPQQKVEQSREAPTVAELWAEYWKRHGTAKKTGVEDERQWKKFIKPKLGTRKLADLSYSDIADFHEAMADTPIQANRNLALLSKMFSFAMHPLEWAVKNPTKGVARFKENKRKRYMTAAEAAKIATFLHSEEASNPASVAFIRLLILTGARAGEIAKAGWDQVDGNKIVLSEHKTDRTGNDRVIHLPPAALAVLENLPKTTGTITGIRSPRGLWESIRTQAGCPDLHLHDLRHSFASAGVTAGLTLAQIGELLGHSSTETTKRYAHLVDEAALSAASLAAAEISARMAG